MVSMVLESTTVVLTDVMLKQRRAWRHAQLKQNRCQMQIFFSSVCLVMLKCLWKTAAAQWIRDAVRQSTANEDGLWGSGERPYPG